MISCFTNICLLLLNFQFTILLFNSFSFNGKLNEKDLLISQDSLILGENFENDISWEKKSNAYPQFAEEHAFEVVDFPVFSGNKSGKFELRYGDKMATKNGGPRAEVLFPKQSHFERWYSFAVFFPSLEWGKDQDDELISQWHSGKGTPTLALRVISGNLKLRIGYDSQIPSSKWNYYDFGSLPKDRWDEFVFHVIHSIGKDGLVEVWRNGEKLVTHNGPNMYREGNLPRWKIGIYKSSWSKRKTDVDLRVVYFDNIKLADENADLNFMMSNEIQ
ncbi:polysaccharide lyase [Cyclobacterium sp. 1_MG-2023]|uniref:polysaccharide lyase n=1 Tax=Cyclobacterium sp. 1_MG-2023 TaxID=3062681 RepID=UPI0026E481D0|nr:polysaccharide lyase [Cyclobacterium sp. 1_MG-2023]MDO6440368.1 polysaccharide lyase [Cyclobacterium sp. 1_MG-2023]